MSKHTPGPWAVGTETDGAPGYVYCDNFAGSAVALVYGHKGMNYSLLPRQEAIANARLIAAAPTQHEEMVRFLPVIERAEADSELWARLTEGLGIATANAYRAAIAKATGGDA